jgi:hypothetical protein
VSTTLAQGAASVWLRSDRALASHKIESERAAHINASAAADEIRGAQDVWVRGAWEQVAERGYRSRKECREAGLAVAGRRRREWERCALCESPRGAKAGEKPSTPHMPTDTTRRLAVARIALLVAKMGRC